MKLRVGNVYEVDGGLTNKYMMLAKERPYGGGYMRMQILTNNGDHVENSHCEFDLMSGSYRFNSIIRATREIEP